MSPSPDPTALRRSPLHDRHVAAGASLTGFAGWEMPLRYESELAEHHAVRRSTGAFDLSHMAEIHVTGRDAPVLLDAVLTGSFRGMRVGRAKYSLMLDDCGRIVDDVIVYRIDDEDFLVVANAANRGPVRDRIEQDAAGRDAAVSDETERTALVAVQGPESERVLAAVEGLEESPGIGVDLGSLSYYACRAAQYRGTPIVVARTGYTGEDGFEVYLAPEYADLLWDDVLAVGAVPCGLACRDTLRLEAGMPLYGHELDRTVTPAQAGLGRVVAPDKTEALAAAGLGAPVGAPVLVGLTGEGRRAPRAGYPLLRAQDDALDEAVGHVTSGALSPTLGHPIAMGYVSPDLAEPGTALVVDIRGTRAPVTVTDLPFYRREKEAS